MTEPAPIQASSPISTGASKTASTPVRTLRPNLVRTSCSPGWACGRARGLRALGGAPLARGHEGGERSRDIGLALGVVRCQTLERGPERLRRGGVDPAVDLAQCGLAGSGAAGLAGPGEPTVAVTD